MSFVIDPDLAFLLNQDSDPNQDYLMNKTYSHFNSCVYDPDPTGFVDRDLDLDPGSYLQIRKNTEIL